MRRYFIILVILQFLGIGVSWLPSHCRASVVAALSTEEMVAQADAIVVGTIGTQQSEMTEQGLIITRSEVVVSETIKGETHLLSRTLTTLGGEIGDLGMTVPGEARFQSGERVVLFLHGKGREVVRPIGMAQGAFHVHRVNQVDMVDRDLREMKRVGPVQRGATTPQRLDDFLSEVRVLARNNAGNP